MKKSTVFRQRLDVSVKILDLLFPNWSHQRLAPQAEAEQESEEEEEWKAMPALGEYDIYDEENRLVARAAPVEGKRCSGSPGSRWCC